MDDPLPTRAVHLNEFDLTLILELLEMRIDRLYENNEDEHQNEIDELQIFESQLMDIYTDLTTPNQNKNALNPPDVDPLIANPEILEIL
jgi:hypothetical protein